MFLSSLDRGSKVANRVLSPTVEERRISPSQVATKSGFSKPLRPRSLHSFSLLPSMM